MSAVKYLLSSAFLVGGTFAAAVSGNCIAQFVNPLDFTKTPSVIVDRVTGTAKISLAYPPNDTGSVYYVAEMSPSTNFSTPCLKYIPEIPPVGVNLLRAQKSSVVGDPCIYDTYILPLTSLMNPTTSVGCSVTSSKNVSDYEVGYAHFNIYKVTGTAKLGTLDVPYLQYSNPFTFTMMANKITSAHLGVHTSAPSVIQNDGRNHLSVSVAQDPATEAMANGTITIKTGFKINPAYTLIYNNITASTVTPLNLTQSNFLSAVGADNFYDYTFVYKVADICKNRGSGSGSYALNFVACAGNDKNCLTKSTYIPFTVTFDIQLSQLCVHFTSSSFGVVQPSSPVVYDTNGSTTTTALTIGQSYSIRGKLVSEYLPFQPTIANMTLISWNIDRHITRNLMVGALHDNANVSISLTPSNDRKSWEWVLTFIVSVGSPESDYFFSTNEVSTVTSTISDMHHIAILFNLSYENARIFSKRNELQTVELNPTAEVSYNFKVKSSEAHASSARSLHSGISPFALVIVFICSFVAILF